MSDALEKRPEQAVVPEDTVAQVRKIARARGEEVIGRMADLAMEAEHDRDAVSAGRLVMEVAGAIGSGQTQVAVGVQVWVHPGGFSAMLQEAEPKAPSKEADAR